MAGISAKRQGRIESVERLRAKFQQAKSFLLTDYRGLTVAEITELRRRLRETQAEYRVIKNTLALRAAKDLGLHGLDGYLEGPTGVALGHGELVDTLKVLSTFAKHTPALTIKVGYVDGRVISREEVLRMAELPSREVLRAQIVGAIQGPLTKLVYLLAGPAQELVYVVEARRQQSPSK